MALLNYDNYFAKYKPILKKVLTDSEKTDITSSKDIEEAKKGNKILIKKKNRGKFTEYCGGTVTQACIDKAKKSSDPTLRKRATFADNSRRWHK